MKQITNHLLMVRPANFGFNKETASNNAFQNSNAEIDDASVKAQVEFDVFVTQLREAGVDVTVVFDTELPVKPDCVFPNNWISFHQDGSIVLYPMFAKSRRLERENGVMDQLNQKFRIDRVESFVKYEDDGLFLEGTGSLILDRQNKIVYASRSVRTDESVLDKWCAQLSYEKIIFDAFDDNGGPIYHTNVMMALGEKYCVICLDSIHDIDERARIIECIEATDKEIIEIDYEQLNCFAGNMLEVVGKNGRILVMSQSAYQSLNQYQIESIENYSEILYSDLTTIETLGGGSARCMMAEVFLPLKKM